MSPLLARCMETGARSEDSPGRSPEPTSCRVERGHSSCARSLAPAFPRGVYNEAALGSAATLSLSLAHLQVALKH